jgi:hypothetical protein
VFSVCRTLQHHCRELSVLLFERFRVRCVEDGVVEGVVEGLQTLLRVCFRVERLKSGVGGACEWVSG